MTGWGRGDGGGRTPRGREEQQVETTFYSGHFDCQKQTFIRTGSGGRKGRFIIKLTNVRKSRN